MAFWHIKFRKSEVQDAFKLLCDEGMLRPIAFSLNGELRYDIYDPSVKKFLEDCWESYKLVYSITELIWNKIRAPTTDEIKWLEVHMGAKTANGLRTRTYIERNKHFRKIRNKKLYLKQAWPKITDRNDVIKRSTEYIKKNHTNIIEKYRFPFDDLLEIIYPKCLQQLAAPKVDRST